MKILEKKTIYFKFKNHPKDLFRDCSVNRLPNPKTSEADFWVWFHPNYQNSDDIALINDLFVKLEREPLNSILINDIEELRKRITYDSFENFYEQISNGNIIIIKKTYGKK